MCFIVKKLPFVPNAPFPFGAADILSPAENPFNAVADRFDYLWFLLFFLKKKTIKLIFSF